MNTCLYSGEKFGYTSKEIELREKLRPRIGNVHYPLPILSISPRVREIHRLLFQNERNLYKTRCSFSGKPTISRIHPDVGVDVFANEIWSSDVWDAYSYGVSYEGGHPFNYIKRLAWSTPYQNLIGSSSNVKNNAVYTNCTADISNSYYVFDSHTVQNCSYSTKLRKCEYVYDCLGLTNCRRCYECIDSEDLYQGVYLQESVGCRSCFHCFGCIGCSYCIGCVGLSNQSYMIYNSSVSKEEYDQFLKTIASTGEDLHHYVMLRNEYLEKNNGNVELSKDNTIKSCTGVTGCKNLYNCQDMCYCYDMGSAQDCLDVNGYGHDSFLMYNSSQVGRYSHHIYCSSTIGKGSHIYYCMDVKKSQYCFGCVNMRDKEYCIFNKQYTKKEYEALVPILIKAMGSDRGTGLSSQMSIFPYNDTKAGELYPPYKLIYPDATEELVDEKGYGTMLLTPWKGSLYKAQLHLGGEKNISTIWKGEGAKHTPIPYQRAGSIDLSSHSPQERKKLLYKNDIVKSIFLCSVTGKPYRVTKSEQNFYQKMNLSLPFFHHDMRAKIRRDRRNYT